MPISTAYNAIAGRSVERVAALSDGIFGVAMTLLLLDLHMPGREAIHSDHDLALALAHLTPQLLVYLLSFLTLGIFWVGQQVQLSNLASSDRHLTWLHLGFLFVVTIMPFSTQLLAEFISYRSALLVYWGNILLLGILINACWRRALSARLINPDFTAEQARAVCHRILTAQALYALGAGLCIINTYVSITAIILVQLNYVVAPTFRARAAATTSAPGGQ